MLERITSPAGRQWLYGVCFAALATLVGLNLVDPQMVPLWLDLAGAVLGIGGTGTAALVVSKQRKDGTLE
ncbi:hypothetical protein [Mycolicibacterium gilvum]|uniref:hypothetical protein n=1 Tax=Mycolicibacterium gilvum TaxID=1804 RepID=UPI00404661B3